MKTKSSKPVEEKSGRLSGRVDIRTQVGTSDSTLTGSLDVQDALRRDTVIYPFGDRLWGHADGASEIGLRAKGPENAGENCAGHNLSVIHRQFMSVNDQMIAYQPMDDESTGMDRRMPQPDGYANFAAWVRAAYEFTGGQAPLARAVGVSPQAITKYLAGRSATPETIEKFAAWAGVPYAKLRMLVDGRPNSEVKQIKERLNQTATPLGSQVGRQWEQIQDSRVRDMIAMQIQHELERQNKAAMSRKKTGSGD